MTAHERYKADIRRIRAARKESMLRAIQLRHEAWKKFVARYVFSHPDLTITQCGKALGISHAHACEMAVAQGVRRRNP
jgi:hypothetical protein